MYLNNIMGNAYNFSMDGNWIMKYFYVMTSCFDLFERRDDSGTLRYFRYLPIIHVFIISLSRDDANFVLIGTLPGETRRFYFLRKIRISLALLLCQTRSSPVALPQGAEDASTKSAPYYIVVYIARSRRTLKVERL